MKKEYPQEFIDKVKKNLPPPENSGPKTQQGKQRVKYNALKHGLNTEGLLPCLPGKCFYKKAICPLENETDFSNVCVVEAARYLQLKESFDKEPYCSMSVDLVQKYIRNTILLERVNRYIAVSASDPVSDIYAEKLHRKLQNKQLMLLKEIIKEEASYYEKQ